jgi:hypothetical protein
MRYFGVGMPSRQNVAAKRIPAAGAAAKEEAMQKLRKLPYFQVSFDGGKGKYCEDAPKMVGVCKGGSVFTGVINTRDETLDSDRWAMAGHSGCAGQASKQVGAGARGWPLPISLVCPLFHSALTRRPSHPPQVPPGAHGPDGGVRRLAARLRRGAGPRGGVRRGGEAAAGGAPAPHRHHLPGARCVRARPAKQCMGSPRPKPSPLAARCKGACPLLLGVFAALAPAKKSQHNPNAIPAATQGCTTRRRTCATCQH